MNTRIICLVSMIIAMSVLTAGTALASTYPQVTVDFDPVTYTYTYHVVTTTDLQHNFGQLLVYAHVWNWDEDLETEVWTMSGPFVGGVDQSWSASYSMDNQFGGDTAEWRASGGGVVAAGTAWSGDFVLVAPNTQPISGLVITKNGIGSDREHTGILVPGAAPVPEPSSALALAGFVGLASSMLRRRSR